MRSGMPITFKESEMMASKARCTSINDGVKAGLPWAKDTSILSKGAYLSTLNSPSSSSLSESAAAASPKSSTP